MRDRDATAAKLEAFLEVLDDLIGETLAAGVSEAGLRRTLLARAVTLFKSPDALPDGIAALDHFRRALERELVPLYGRGGG
jgi:hypothetical protein